MTKYLSHIMFFVFVLLVSGCSNYKEEVLDDGCITLIPQMSLIDVSAESRVSSEAEAPTINYCCIQLVNKYSHSTVQQNSYKIMSDNSLRRITTVENTSNYFNDDQYPLLYVNNGKGYYNFRVFANIDVDHAYHNSDYSDPDYHILTSDVPSMMMGSSYVETDGTVQFTMRPLTSSLKLAFFKADGFTIQEVDSVLLVDVNACSFDLTKVVNSIDSTATESNMIESMENSGILVRKSHPKYFPKYGVLYIDDILPKTYMSGIFLRIYTTDLVEGVRTKKRYDVPVAKEGYTFQKEKRYSIRVLVDAKQAKISGGIVVDEMEESPNMIELKYGPES